MGKKVIHYSFIQQEPFADCSVGPLDEDNRGMRQNTAGYRRMPRNTAYHPNTNATIRNTCDYLRYLCGFLRTICGLPALFSAFMSDNQFARNRR